MLNGRIGLGGESKDCPVVQIKQQAIERVSPQIFECICIAERYDLEELTG